MKITEIRTLSTEEIQGKLDDVREELFRLRFQVATGQLTDTTRLSATRRNLARMMTVLRERELAAEILAQTGASAASGEG
jgi:large subunit ribosomal protein L29